MGRRFPTPLIGLETSEQRYRTLVDVATGPETPVSHDTYIDRCQSRLTKPGSEDTYSRSYVTRILSSYTELGVIQRTDDEIRPSPFADDWLEGEFAFSEFIWKSMKRSWVAMGTKPEGIEGLNRIVHVLEAVDGGLTQGEIETHLQSEYAYEFNNEGIRGYPEILELLGLIDKDGSTLILQDSSVVKKYKRRFRGADIFRTLEARLKREGSTVTPPSKTAKRDLMKYYMYREAGGWNKRRQWFKTFWRDYLQPETRNGKTGDELRRSSSYREETDHRRQLRDDITDEFRRFDSTDLRGLSADILERIKDAESEPEARRIQLSSGSGISSAELELLTDDSRPTYLFPGEFSLYDWQREAVTEWYADTDASHKHRGIAQVVTGAGKTVMALEVIRRWLADNPGNKVTVVVPTRVLMRQWLTELTTTLNVPVDDIGWAGGGHKDSVDDCRILVSIVNSAVKDNYLRTQLRETDYSEHLLIADECHRYTGDTFSNVLRYPKDATLGLSATPLSQGEGTTDSDQLLLDTLGDIFYQLTYDEGIRRGLIPEFTIKYIGFDLAEPERQEYDALSQKVSDAVKDIKQQYDHRLYELRGSFAQKLQTIRSNTDRPTPAIGDYFRYTQDRRELVANAVARQAITLQLLRDAIDNGEKTIVFQERIEQLEQLIAPHDSRGRNVRSGELSDAGENYRARLYDRFEGLKTADKKMEALFADTDYWPVMYHSGHSREVWNDIAMDWFRADDMANVMLSVKALVEGVDVPSADVGIVRVSSSSIRQRIQTLGRILRTGEDASSESTLYVLYARDTVDERIFREYDWQEELASANVEHHVWARDAEEGYATGEIRPATPEEYPPRPEPNPVPDPEELGIGDDYPGPRDPVAEVSVSSDGRLFKKTRLNREYLDTTGFEEVINFVHRAKGGGTVKVNSHGHLYTVLQDGPVFVGTVESPSELTDPDSTADEDDPEPQSGSLTEDDPDLDDIF